MVVRTQKKSKMTYSVESTYGTQIAAPDYFLMHFLKYDPKDEIVFEPIETLDGGTRDVEGFIKLLEKYEFSITGRPIHGVVLPYLYGYSSTAAGTPTTHFSFDPDIDNAGLNSQTIEITLLDESPNGHTVWYDGCKINSAEFTFSGGKPVELTLDYVAQDSGSSTDDGQDYETVDLNGKYYDPATKRPFSFGDVRVEIQGADFNPIDGRLRIENNLDIVPLCDDDIGNKISEPFPTRRKYEFEISGRMSADTYYDLWKAGGTSIGTTTGILANGAILAGDTQITYDGTASPASSVPSSGILLIDSEYIYYASKTSTTFDGCVRGISSTAAGHADTAVITIYGNINLQFNRGANDSIRFFMWGGILSAYSTPIDAGGDVVVESLVYTPAKCVWIAQDDITAGYI